jgi:predicted enzyme related to lactoylglutathione lyase
VGVHPAKLKAGQCRVEPELRRAERCGSPGALIKIEGCPSGPGGTLIYFSCEDCAVEEARAVSAGGRVFKPKFSIGPYGFIALVFDSEGNLIGLHSRK